MRRVGVIADEIFCRHRTPQGHPERPDRIRALIDALETWSRADSIIRLEPAGMSAEGAELVHTGGHVETIAATAGGEHSILDPDTHTSPDSFEVALTAAGSTVVLTRQVLEGRLNHGVALVRPPGHHAETDRAMGFCLFNNAALAAETALRELGLSRVAIVDFDVHHGNGTQEIFYERAEVLYVSNHQYPFYPGTGAATERGSGAGLGATLNLPMPAGTADAFVLAAYRELVLPALARFEPELLLVSAGFDAHRLDPLGGMEMTAEGFATLAAQLLHAADSLCGGRTVFVLEGGYSLEGLASSVIAVLETCLEPPSEVELAPAPAGFEDYRRKIEAAWDL